MIHEFQNEAFIYLWYDAPNKKYYLGKHKGSPDDTYTHSSTIWESFTKDNIPEGVTRRILAEGTDEEMCILENKLLINRKDRCWNRYYNNSLGDPRYADQWGENNSYWKGGISYDKKAYNTEHYKKNIDMWKEQQKKPKRKAWQKEYDKKRKNCPKRKAWRKKYDVEYHARKKSERQGEGTLEPFLG